MKKLRNTQVKHNKRKQKAELSAIKLADIKSNKQLLTNQKNAINAKLKLGNTMTSKEKKKLKKKSTKREKQLAKLTKNEDSRTAKDTQIKEVLTSTELKLKERKELAGITNIKETMTTEQKQESVKREKNFTNSVLKFKTRFAEERIRKTQVRQGRLTKSLERKQKKLSKLEAKKKKQTTNTQKLGFFGKIFNGFKKKVSDNNVNTAKSNVNYLKSQISPITQAIEKKKLQLDQYKKEASLQKSFTFNNSTI
jgi:hypothetical protein